MLKSVGGRLGFGGLNWDSLIWVVVVKKLMLHAPMPNSFAFSSAAAAAILAASRESVGRLFVADMLLLIDARKYCVVMSNGLFSGEC